MSYGSKGPLSRADKLICDIKGTHDWDYMSDLSGKTHACGNCGKVVTCTQETSPVYSMRSHRLHVKFDCAACELRYTTRK